MLLWAMLFEDLEKIGKTLFRYRSFPLVGHRHKLHLCVAYKLIGELIKVIFSKRDCVKSNLFFCCSTFLSILIEQGISYLRFRCFPIVSHSH